MLKEFQPGDIVKSCPYLEMGSCFSTDGIYCCVHGTQRSPKLISSEDIKSGKLNYEFIVEKRKELFYSINDENDHSSDNCKFCSNLIEKKFEDVCFDYLGGQKLPAGFNIQHYTECNQRCKYCLWTKNNFFVKPEYEILHYFDIFKEKGKIRGGNWVDFSGGEPAMLKNFDEILDYLIDINFGQVVVYSNCVKFSQSIFNALKQDKIILTTSVDTGVASIYKKLRGNDTFSKIISNLIKYRNSGTHGLWLKYVICEENRNDDSLWSFLITMMALKPNNIMICPDFPYDDKRVSDETVDFAAKLWVLVEKHLNMTPIDYTSTFGAPEWVKYHEDLNKSIDEYRKKIEIEPLDNIFYLYNSVLEKNDLTTKLENDLNKIKYNINKLAWWIPIRKWRDNFRNKMLNTDQTRPDQTRPDQTRP
ncbi:radical SAM protein [uncultured Brachyspira sp.]|uniref:radical SAM protein n=1 Tax=uncultured Brachyspira sp. TaxID=221953 RepID=UPI002625C649|nr:radical SAM protein [uncultured Brachyspira sp.]